MSQQFNVDFGRQGKGLPQPFQVGGQKQSLQDRLIGAAQLRQARLNESRRRLERAQTIDRQDLQALAGYDAGQLADSFRPLFQQDVEEVRKFVIENEIDFNNDYHQLLKDLFNVIHESKLDFDKKRMCQVIISEAMYKHQIVMDSEINAYACFLQISEVIS